MYEERKIPTLEGSAVVRYYRTPSPRRAFLCAGGVGGGWDSPAQGLFPRLCEHFQSMNIASLRVRYRNPHSLRSCVADVIAGLDFLERENHVPAVLAGHSLGGAMVFQAALHCRAPFGIIALAPQGQGLDAVSRLGSYCFKAFLHGERDGILPPACSERGFRLASPPKQLILYSGAEHCLDEVAEDCYRDVVKLVLRGTRQRIFRRPSHARNVVEIGTPLDHSLGSG